MGFLDITKKLKLDKMKDDLLGKTGLEKLRKITDNINLNNISLPDLKALTNSRYTQGVAWGSLSLATMTSDVMNKIAPGSLDTGRLKKQLSNTILTKGSVTEMVDTQSGMMAMKSSLNINGDVEDVFGAKALSQGTNLQMANRGSQIRSEASSSKTIPSSFVGREVVS